MLYKICHCVFGVDMMDKDGTCKKCTPAKASKSN